VVPFTASVYRKRIAPFWGNTNNSAMGDQAPLLRLLGVLCANSSGPRIVTAPAPGGSMGLVDLVRWTAIRGSMPPVLGDEHRYIMPLTRSFIFNSFNFCQLTVR